MVGQSHSESENAGWTRLSVTDDFIVVPVQDKLSGTSLGETAYCRVYGGRLGQRTFASGSQYRLANRIFFDADVQWDCPGTIGGIASVTCYALSDTVFAVDPDTDALVTLNSDLEVQDVQFGPFVSGLQNASSVSAVPVVDGAVYVTSPTAGTVSWFDRTSGTPTFAGQVSVPGARKVVVSTANLNKVYVLGSDSNRVAVFDRDPNTSALTPAADLTGSFGVPNDIEFFGSQIFVSGSAGVELIGGGFQPLANAGTLSLTNFPNTPRHLIVARPEADAVSIFDVRTGSLTPLQTFQNGVGGVVGLSDVSDVTNFYDTATETFLFFAVSPTDNSIVTFLRDETDRWADAGRVRQGASGAAGLAMPTSLAVDTARRQLIVGSQGQDAVLGGLAKFEVLDLERLVTAPSFAVSYEGVNQLSVVSAAGSDRVTVRNPEANLTVETSGGDDQVIVLGTLPGRSATVNLGAGSDRFELRGNNSPVTANGGSGADGFRVDGQQIAGPVTINGNDPTTVPGDTLLVSGVDNLPNGNGNGNVTVNGQTVSYTSIENPVADTSNFTVNPGGPYTVFEGFDVQLNASASGGTGIVQYAWDLNGNGEFSDATGAAPIATWGTLQFLGIDDDGVYPVTVQATDADGNTSQATVDLTILNVLPTINVQPSSTLFAADQPLTLTLTSTDAGDDQIHTWLVGWGDGTPLQFYNAGMDVTSLTHTYAEAGDYVITISGVDEDAQAAAIPTAITVTAPVPTVRTISGNSGINEGLAYSLGLNATGPGISNLSGWVINWGDGTQQEITGSPASVTHVYDLPGSYLVQAVTVEDGQQRSCRQFGVGRSCRCCSCVDSHRA